MTTIIDDSLKYNTLGTYDVIVLGGGITGLAIARTLAMKGLHIALIEPTGILGREITRARNMFVHLEEYVDDSITIQVFYECLLKAKGWFNGVIDPNAAALAFDEMLNQCKVQVLFHTWPSHLLHDDLKVNGLVVATNNGYALMKTEQVIDASFYGKLGRSWFYSKPSVWHVSVLNLTFNGVEGTCPYESKLIMPDLGDVKVLCRPTHWKNEWLVSLILERKFERAEWIVLLADLLPILQQEIHELRSGVLAYVADDVYNTPHIRISTKSKDDRIIGYLDKSKGKSVGIYQRMLCDKTTIQGLTLAGNWIDGISFDPRIEEASIINSFKLGDLIGTSFLK